ncbi:MAG: hypothetical protein MUF71_11015 [Candidatus Kapabacteria bacterium]|nr:hypothetical protein [Candidatus Kapabacteria bacterium]
MQRLFRVHILLFYLCIFTSGNIASAQDQITLSQQDSLSILEREKQWFADVEYVNTPRLAWGAGTDMAYIMQNFTTPRFLRFGSNFLGLRSTDKISGYGTSFTICVDVPVADNLFTMRLGYGTERSRYNTLERVGLQISGMTGTFTMVDLEQSLTTQINTVTLGASFRRRMINSLFAEIGVESAVLLNSTLEYTEFIDNFQFPINDTFEGTIPQTQPYFQAFGGLSYNFPSRSEDSIFTLSPYIRYYYPLSPFTSFVDWKTSRLCLGLEMRL